MYKLESKPSDLLLMRWGSRPVDSDIIKSFYTHIDLDSVRPVWEEIINECEWYDEFIQNKEFTIQTKVGELLNKNELPGLVIILSSGPSHLSLDLLERFNSKIHCILEVDISGMEKKQEVYDLHYPEYSDKIKCMTADLTSSKILEFLNQIVQEYFEECPAIVLMEDIGYYLEKNELEKLIKCFKSRKKNTALFIEYLLPEDKISNKMKKYVRKIFNTIEKSDGTRLFKNYDSTCVEKILKQAGGKLVSKSSLVDMERIRSGRNKIFKDKKDNWLETEIWQI